MGLVYNNNIKNFQVELRLLQDINNDVGRMGSEIFKNRHSIARHIFLGNDFLLVVKQSYGKDSFLIVSLKNLSLYAKIKCVCILRLLFLCLSSLFLVLLDYSQ